MGLRSLLEGRRESRRQKKITKVLSKVKYKGGKKPKRFSKAYWAHYDKKRRAIRKAGLY